MNRVVIAAAGIALVAVAAYPLMPRSQAAPPAEVAIKSSWATAAPDWQARLAQDETQKACSQYRNAPPKAVADAILAREKATIQYPADGKLMGDWKKGEALAQSGYGGRFTDYPPRAENGGNCYACHQLDDKELSFGTLGPCLARIRQDPQIRGGRGKGGLRADLQPAGRHSLCEHATPGRQQVPDHRANQGSGGLRDVAGKPR